MVYVEGGDFFVGSIGKQNSQTVKINNYFISAFEVTVSEYQLFVKETDRSMPPEPKWGWKKDHPIVNVTYEEALAYCEWLSKKNNSTFRLPTEVEWEYAARGGKKSKNYKFSGSNNPSRVAWFRVNSGNKTYAVGKKKANELGLYDMSGNAWEWCMDWYKEYTADKGDEIIDLEKASGKIVRGGAANRLSPYCKLTKRLASYSDCRSAFNGFRVVEISE
ncbi:formylglycine-generating enzyme family protein [Pseudopedobacter beijingensis]|uniref:Formylglycine-generating enzyme family protein n=1 Tax=Pseudopedobacter beijingensis TaxID=1207056 RepID=A0ABW4I6C7_9SPHI